MEALKKKQKEMGPETRGKDLEAGKSEKKWDQRLGGEMWGL